MRATAVLLGLLAAAAPLGPFVRSAGASAAMACCPADGDEDCCPTSSASCRLTRCAPEAPPALPALPPGLFVASPVAAPPAASRPLIALASNENPPSDPPDRPDPPPRA